MRRSNTEKLDEILSQVLKQNHLDEKLYEVRVIKSWSVVLGENIMNYTSNIYFSKKKLYVTLSSSVLRQELFLSRDNIKKLLNENVGADVVQEIVFK
jgi:predicted nucleic acid-binding Zn ribbon protein